MTNAHTGAQMTGTTPIPTRFSEHFQISKSPEDDWFDVLLTQDTRLSLDPFLISLEESDRWANGHARLMSFFNIVLELLAKANGNESSNLYRKAQALMLFPEPHEFCLGYSEDNVFGAGSGKGLQLGMLKGAEATIALGLEDLRHFEEIALFGEQIAADRIGDIACNVLKKEFIEYTQDICRRHEIQMTEVNVSNASWDDTRKAWISQVVHLPLNEYASEIRDEPVGVILTPRRFLRRIPSINHKDFWDYAFAKEGSQIRSDFNYQIGEQINSAKVARLARERRHLLTQYMQELEEEPGNPYDVVADPDLVVRKVDFAKKAVAASPDLDTDDIGEFVERLVHNFIHFVESEGWRLLWVDDKPRRESQVQSLFAATAKLACQIYDIDMSAETDAGRGPVDFKFSRGRHMRALLELKLAKSSSFRRNLKHQLPIYSAAEDCDLGFFVAVQFTDKDFAEKLIKDATQAASRVKDMDFRLRWVDARRKPSASTV